MVSNENPPKCNGQQSGRNAPIGSEIGRRGTTGGIGSPAIVAALLFATRTKATCAPSKGERLPPETD